MYHDSHQNGERSKRPNDTPESCASTGEGKDLLASHSAGAAPRLSGAAQRVMDGLLRECLRRKSLAP
jgi:hypothetical protein